MNKNITNKNAYEFMSIVYDSLTEDIDYNTWYQQVKYLFNSQTKKPIKLLELGAGTGNMTTYLVKDAYSVTVLEPSLSMLSVLQEKCIDYMSRLQFYNGSLDTFNTTQTYDAVVGFLDILNYIQPAELNEFFNRLSELLTADGLVLLDYSTIYKLEHVIGDTSFAETHDEFAFIWENYYDPNEKNLDFEFTLFTEEEDGRYSRSHEFHTQYAHDIDALKAAFSGKFELIAHFGDDLKSLLKGDNRRHIFLKKINPSTPLG